MANDLPHAIFWVMFFLTLYGTMGNIEAEAFIDNAVCMRMRGENMAYSELVKNFNRIRDYMREFYVYGFKSRDEYTEKSARSYDDERRRIESWLGDYMQFRRSAEGKNVFLSIDSRMSAHNPLYKAWKAKSFTDGDITLHFLLFDILSSPEICLSMKQITEKLDEYPAAFPEPRMFDESTVRKKLKEYVLEGLLETEKKGKAVYYRRVKYVPLPGTDMLDFFSEVFPCGVIGSFLLDKHDGEHETHFAFKHHYITGAMDSEILCLLLMAIREKRSVALEIMNRRKGQASEWQVIPLKIMISAQTGRQYLMAYVPDLQRITSFRADSIRSVKAGAVCEQYEELQEKLGRMLPHMWGVSTQSCFGSRMEHVEFTVRYADDERYIRNRLERERRCGTVEHLDDNTSRFSADVYDAEEMIPWIRTFLCRITELHFSNAELEARFQKDLHDMYALYDLGGDA